MNKREWEERWLPQQPGLGLGTGSVSDTREKRKGYLLRYDDKVLSYSDVSPLVDLNITCRYAGVFHVEKNGRYSISRTEAADLCEAFNSTLPTMEQMKLALSKGFETCRYGFIEGHVVIPRITPNAICAANNTGVYVLTSNTSHYDTYCFNASAPLEEDCTSVTDLPSSFEGQVTITIVNRDGTRYSKKGEYRKHQEDIDASNSTDDDVSSGFSSEKSTAGGYVFHTYFPTESPTGDQDDPFFIGSTPATTRSGSNDGRRGSNLPKDATTSLEGYTPHYPMENGTLMPVTPAKTGVFGENEVTVPADSDFNVNGSLPGDGDLTKDPRGVSLTVTHESGLAGHSSGSHDGDANTTPGPGRRPQIPEWLIILASLLALALILAVCIAVNSRRRCGQKKKLVINSGNGKVEDRKPSELNGEASKSQEMVHLVNKEPSETPDQFMTADETRNLQNVDMKIGV
ncbi:hypothetical protein STEG23_003859 [Scotinomys teguina]